MKCPNCQEEMERSALIVYSAVYHCNGCLILYENYNNLDRWKLINDEDWYEPEVFQRILKLKAFL
jgi:hypothetical protein